MMNKQQIKELALANGFKLKPQPDGTEDLNPYVYEFALALAESTHGHQQCPQLEEDLRALQQENASTKTATRRVDHEYT